MMCHVVTSNGAYFLSPTLFKLETSTANTARGLVNEDGIARS
jgi:hypothetical protein